MARPYSVTAEKISLHYIHVLERQRNIQRGNTSSWNLVFAKLFENRQCNTICGNYDSGDLRFADFYYIDTTALDTGSLKQVHGDNGMIYCGRKGVEGCNMLMKFKK